MILFLPSVDQIDINPQSLRDSSPMYGLCDPNRRFGQNLTLEKGAFVKRERSDPLPFLSVMSVSTTKTAAVGERRFGIME